MDISEIKNIIGGFQAPVHVKRQAWIEYGKLLLACPYTGRRQIGEWVVAQGLDFVEDFQDRSAAKRLVHYREIPIMDKCPYSSPVDVLKWLRDNGHIECKRRDKPADTKQDTASAAPLPVSDTFDNLAVQLSNAARAFVSDQSVMSALIKKEAAGEDCAIAKHIVDIPAPKTWWSGPGPDAEHKTCRTVGIRFRVIAEPVWYDVEAADGNGFVPAPTAETASFKEFYTGRVTDGLAYEV
jgi:hypothetical protein